tara:strand:+ start:2542 stop:3636 length:1095 start_codon:yes stop_codon:yes gene_type:complete
MIKKDKKHFFNILEKYYKEINEFSYELAKRFHRDNQIYKRGAFSDMEGIFLYCLIREYKPNLIFEISPDTGMSTNYILQAVSMNNKGKVIGFELEPYKHSNIPTLDVITLNQSSPELVDKFYSLVIGDATKTCDLERFGRPDIVLIDSCHEDFFAEWYLNNLIPFVNQFSLIQDITYEHKVEGSSEATTVIDYLNDKIPYLMIDNFREWLLFKNDYYPVRNFLTNSILISGTENEIESDDSYKKNLKFKNIIDKKESPSLEEKCFLIHNSFPGGNSQFSSRYLAYCLSYEKNKYLYQWLTDLFIGSLFISRSRYKDITYSLAYLNRNKKNNYNFLILISKIAINFPLEFTKSLLKIIVLKIKLN